MLGGVSTFCCGGWRRFYFSIAGQSGVLSLQRFRQGSQKNWRGLNVETRIHFARKNESQKRNRSLHFQVYMILERKPRAQKKVTAVDLPGISFKKYTGRNIITMIPFYSRMLAAHIVSPPAKPRGSLPIVYTSGR